MIKIVRLIVFNGITLSIFLCNDLNAQTNQAAMAAADTSRFSVNKAGGWQLFNSYISTFSTDSVNVELVLQHAKDLNWQQYQLIGKIKFSAALPSTGKVIPFCLLENKYAVRIDKDGNCYLSFISGSLPATNPVVLPVVIHYRL